MLFAFGCLQMSEEPSGQRPGIIQMIRLPTTSAQCLQCTTAPSLNAGIQTTFYTFAL